MKLTPLFLLVPLLVAGYLRTVHGRSLSGVVRAIEALPVFTEDRAHPDKPAQLRAIAEAVERHGKTATQRALLLVVFDAESGMSLRIQRGDCRRWECDYSHKLGRHMARGLGQLHQNGLPESQWAKMIGIEHTDEQVAEAARRIRSALAMCKTPEGALRSLTGKGCAANLPGIERRLKTYEQIIRRL